MAGNAVVVSSPGERKFEGRLIFPIGGRCKSSKGQKERTISNGIAGFHRGYGKICELLFKANSVWSFRCLGLRFSLSNVPFSSRGSKKKKLGRREGGGQGKVCACIFR